MSTKWLLSQFFKLHIFLWVHILRKEKKNQKEMLIVDHFKPDSSQNMLESVWTAIEYAIYIKRWNSTNLCSLYFKESALSDIYQQTRQQDPWLKENTLWSIGIHFTIRLLNFLVRIQFIIKLLLWEWSLFEASS